MLALQLWTQDRSTRQLVNVQLTDARDEVTKAYQGHRRIARRRPTDVRRQAMLTASMTAIIGDLNAASAAVRGLPDSPTRRCCAFPDDFEGGGADVRRPFLES